MSSRQPPPPGPPGLQYPRQLPGASPDLTAAVRNIIDNLFYIRGQISLPSTFTPAQLAQINRIVGTQVQNITSTVTNVTNTTTGSRLVFGVMVGNGTDVITSGVKGYVRIPVACTLTKATILSIDSTGPATAGDIVFDIWVGVFASYPPTNANSITGGNEPALSSANSFEDSALAGWNTSIAAGSVAGFNVDSAATVTQVLLELEASIP